VLVFDSPTLNSKRNETRCFVVFYYGKEERRRYMLAHAVSIRLMEAGLVFLCVVLRKG